MGFKFIIYFCIFLFSIIGSYVPVIWGQSMFSGASILGGAIGSAGGLWIGYKIYRYING